MKIKDTLTNAAKRLNSAEAAIEAQFLLQHVLNVNRAWLIAHENDAIEVKAGQANGPDHPLSNSPSEFDSPCIRAVFEALLNRRLNGEPIAYILGAREFYGLNLKVTVDTLIPRPDTETLVEAALAKIAQNDNPSSSSFPRKRENEYKKSNMESSFEERESMLNLNQKMDSRFRRNDGLRILDLGTGTGAIALAIAKHRPQANVYALDASQAALDIAIENAKTLNINNVTFILSNWFSATQNEKFDVIVSNPPYIEQNDAHLKQGDLRFEPISALASGADGLDAIRAIITQAPRHLNPHGWLMLEHGYNQAKRVAALLKNASFSEIKHEKDLAGVNRVTLGRL